MSASLPVFHARPSRALGTVCTADAQALSHAALVRLGTEHFLTLPLGRAFAVYGVSPRLRLLFISPPQRHAVRALAAARDVTFTADGAAVGVWRRARRIATWPARPAGAGGGDDDDAALRALLVLGPLLLGLSHAALHVWDRASGELHAVLELRPGALRLVHPPALVNKVAVAFADGSLELWNVRSARRVYRFAATGAAVTALAAAPTVADILAVGYDDGRITVLNVREDAAVAALQHADGSAVTGLAFSGAAALVSGSGAGALTVWDLEHRRVLSARPQAHAGAVAFLQALHAQPVLLTAGTDNALSAWVLDTPTSPPRLLRGRTGHVVPPRAVRFADGDSAVLLTASGAGAGDGAAALRVVSAVRDAHNVAFGGAGARDVPPITAVASRGGVVATLHVGEPTVHVWDLGRRAHAGRVLRRTPPAIPAKRRAARLGVEPPPAPAGLPTAVAVSVCGDFVVVGTASGDLERYNVHSGTQRGLRAGAHDDVVTAVCDDVGRVASAGLDGRVVVVGSDGDDRASRGPWDARHAPAPRTLELGTPVTMMRLHRESGLLALASDDLVLRVVDIETVRVVRRFTGHARPLLDLAWAPDGRSVVTAGEDAALRVWDVPSSRCIDHWRVSATPTAVDWAPNGMSVATTHTGCRAVYLWAVTDVNDPARGRPGRRVQLEDAEEHEGESEDDEESDGERGDDGGGEEADEAEYEAEGEAGAVAAAAPGLLRLSGRPASTWRTLPDLATIKERNKPVEPPRAPERAPFFLTAAAGPQRAHDGAADDGDDDEARDDDDDGADADGARRGGSRIRRVRPGDARHDSTLLQALRARRWAAAAAALRAMPPAATDAELRLLPVEGEPALGTALAAFFEDRVASGEDFELVATWLLLVLREHGAHLGAANGARIRAALEPQWQRLERLFLEDLAVLEFAARAGAST